MGQKTISLSLSARVASWLASLYIGSLTVLVSFASSGEPEKPLDLKEQFLSKAPKALEQLERYYAQTEGSYTLTVQQPTETDKYREVVNKIEYIVNNGSFVGRISKPKRTNVAVINQDYRALVTREKEKTKYSLTNVVPNRPNADEEGTLDDVQSTQSDIFVDAALAPCYFLDQPLSLRISDFASRIEKVYPVTQGRKSLVRVDFMPTPLASKLEPIFLLLDPDAFWSLQQYEGVKSVEQQPGQQLSVNVKVKLTYDAQVDGFPRLRQREQKVEVNKSGVPAVRQVVFDTFRHRLAERDEFTLAPYGLPEPNLSGGVRKIPMGVWYLTAALIMGFAMIILLYIRRKKSHGANR